MGLWVYSVLSLVIAHMIPVSLLASATTAICFPRRCLIPSAHLHSASVCGFFTLIIVCAACTNPRPFPNHQMIHFSVFCSP